MRQIINFYDTSTQCRQQEALLKDALLYVTDDINVVQTAVFDFHEFVANCRSSNDRYDQAAKYAIEVAFRKEPQKMELSLELMGF